MRIISSGEFRGHQKEYFELAEKEIVIIYRGDSKKPVLLKPIEESEESDMYFSDPKVINSIETAIKQMKEGKSRKVTLDDIAKILGV